LAKRRAACYQGDSVSNHALIEHDDSILIVIDVQAVFLDKLPVDEQRRLLGRIGWLIGVADWLHIPLVVTAEDAPGLGGVAPEIAQTLPGIAVHNKLVFGLADDPAIMADVVRTARKTAVLVGLETDVCVAQSALGLLDHGHRVVVVADASGSPGTAHAAGLRRMRDAGVVVVDTKSLYYEWMRTVAQVHRFRAERADLRAPEGMRL
jgi:nicotinamidase-related amidase